MSPDAAPIPSAAPHILAGGGETGALMRAHDWSAHPLGLPEAWPQPLKTTVGLMLATGHPMCLAWGPELTLLYNDAYAPILTTRHPRAMGRPIAEVWADVWPDIAPLVDRALAGEAIWQEDLHLVMARGGRDEDTWWTFSYSPLRDAGGTVRGFVNVCNDTTAKIRNERRLTGEREALRESEARFRALVNASSDVVYRMSADWTELCQLDGRGFLADTDRPSVRWLDEYLFPEDRPAVMAAIDEAVRTRGVFELEHRVRRVDGTAGWTFSRAVPVPGAGGEIAEWFGMASDVTERRRTEQRLVDSEHEMRFALKAGRFGAWSLDLASGALTTSETCRANFGRDPKAPFSYAELREAVHPDDAARMAEAVERSVATGAVYDIEYRILTPAGQTRWVAIRAQPSYAADGTPLGLAGVSIDATERKLTEQRLADSERRYRTLFGAIDAGFCAVEVDCDGPAGRIDYRVVEANPAFYRQTGFPETIKGRWLREAVPTLEEFWFETYGRIARTGRPERFEQGSAALGRWFDVYAFRAGEPAENRVAILFNDISARRQAEERLRELNETLERQVADRTAELRQFRDIVEATASPICAFDTDYRLIAFNTAHNDEFRRVNGFDTRLGDVFPDLFVPAQRPVMRALMSRALSGERFTVTEEFGRPELGQPLWEISYTPLRDGNGTIIGAFHLATDISDRRRAEADLAAAQDALRQSQKMEAMGSLTGGVAHDFNNLLTPIVGTLDLLQRKFAGDTREQRLIDGALQSAERAKTLVQRLLAFARRQPLQAEAVDVAALVAGMADLVASTSGPTVRVRIDVAPDLPAALADANQVEMAILNLAVNARDAMPDGGDLTIGAAAETVDATHRAALAPGRYVRLSVADSGAGMDEETVRRAVEPFFSTKGVGKGTGLGLSMVHGLAAQLGGGLLISSEPGSGTRVELWLPSSAEPVKPPARRETAATPARSGTVLLVDDEELVRTSTADMLAELGYAVVEASSAEEAMRRLGDGLSPDLLITDHLMPGMSGTDLIRRVSAGRPLPALLVSGYADIEGVDLDLPRLVKPFRQANLAAAIAGLTAPAQD